MAGKKGKNTAAKKEAKKLKNEQKESKKAAKTGKALFGSDDIDAILEDFAQLDKLKNTVTFKICSPPSPRVNASFVAHPYKDELILYGGEYYNGQKVLTYADLFVYNISKSEWKNVSIPSPPRPRTAHQAVVVPTSNNNASMYIFGGDFTSPSQLFRHYNDLWVLDLNKYTWEQIKATNGPSSRSGHRMVYYKRKIYVFGGFHDNHKDVKYYDDLHVFDIDTQEWSPIKPANKSVPWPSPRSGFGFVVHEGAGCAILSGGYSTQLKKKGQLDEKSIVLSDMWSFDFAKQTWTQLKNGGDAMPARSGVSYFTSKNKIFAFGGVKDVEGEDEDEFESTFYNDLRSYFLKKRAWELVPISTGINPLTGKPTNPEATHSTDDNKKKAKENIPEKKDDSSWKWSDKSKDTPKTKETLVDEEDDNVALLMNLDDEEDEDEDDISLAHVKKKTSYIWPRRNAMICVRNSIVYMFGGVFEKGNCEVTLNDLHYFDTRRGKMTTWYTLEERDLSKQEWFEEEDDDSDDDDDDDDDDEEEDSEDENPRKSRKSTKNQQVDDEEEEDNEEEEENNDPLAPLPDEALQAYFARTKEHWMSEAVCDGLTEKEVRKNAFEMAKMHYTISSM